MVAFLCTPFVLRLRSPACEGLALYLCFLLVTVYLGTLAFGDGLFGSELLGRCLARPLGTARQSKSSWREALHVLFDAVLTTWACIRGGLVWPSFWVVGFCLADGFSYLVLILSRCSRTTCAVVIYKW